MSIIISCLSSEATSPFLSMENYFFIDISHFLTKFSTFSIHYE